VRSRCTLDIISATCRLSKDDGRLCCGCARADDATATLAAAAAAVAAVVVAGASPPLVVLVAVVSAAATVAADDDDDGGADDAELAAALVAAEDGPDVAFCAADGTAGLPTAAAGSESAPEPAPAASTAPPPRRRVSAMLKICSAMLIPRPRLSHSAADSVTRREQSMPRSRRILASMSGRLCSARSVCRRAQEHTKRRFGSNAAGNHAPPPPTTTMTNHADTNTKQTEGEQE
jgi:hypothetical protein